MSVVGFEGLEEQTINLCGFGPQINKNLDRVTKMKSCSGVSTRM